MENKEPLNYTKKTDSDNSFPVKSMKAVSKERRHKNKSYIGVDQRRYNTSKKEDIRSMHNTSYNLPFVAPLTAKNNFGRKMIDIEPFQDPESIMSNSNILNVVSPHISKQGFHITDLLDNSTIKKRVNLNKTELMTNASIFDSGFGSQESQPLGIAQQPIRPANENKYVIKNFRIVNLNDQDSKNMNRTSKPITAAPMMYNNSGARAIRKITAGGSRKGRFNSTSNMKSPRLLPVNNSLLTTNDREKYTDMRPLHNYFDQFFEETHYMFPKHKSKFGFNSKNISQNTAYNSVTRTPANPIEEEKNSELAKSRRSSIINEIREKAVKDKST